MTAAFKCNFGFMAYYIDNDTERKCIMNVLMLLRQKKDTAYIYENNTIRQGMTKMRAHGYTAIPVLSEDGKYVGCVSEGDFLWFQIDNEMSAEKDGVKHYVREIIRKDFSPPARINISMDELLDRVMHQNFVCITDDFDTFIGIVTRQDIIRYFIDLLPKEQVSRDSL